MRFVVALLHLVSRLERIEPLLVSLAVGSPAATSLATASSWHSSARPAQRRRAPPSAAASAMPARARGEAVARSAVTKWGAETAWTVSDRKGSNPSWICGRQQRGNQAARCPRPHALSYMYMCMHIFEPVRELASRPAACRASECRRQVRPAAPRRSARARQRQDDVMTPAGPTDTTSAPSRASRCACVAGLSARGSARGARLSRPRATALEERGEEARGAARAAAGSRELEASRRALATLAGRTARIVSEIPFAKNREGKNLASRFWLEWGARQPPGRFHVLSGPEDDGTYKSLIYMPRCAMVSEPTPRPSLRACPHHIL
eukprot:scaffold66303_cov73-Phaeocystis_antarctica.AAC.1